MELVLAISLSSILVLSIGNFVANSIVGSNQDYNQTLVLSNAKEAVNIVARQIKAARSVLSSNVLADANAPGAPGNLYSWSGAAGSGANLILAVPSRDASNNLIYVDSLHNSLYTDNVIFYLDSSTRRLYKRVIANSSAPGNVAKTTCPPTIATAACPADARVVDNVANLVTSYLNASNAAVTLPSGTEAVNFTVTESRTINGKTYTGSYTSVATLRNK